MYGVWRVVVHVRRIHMNEMSTGTSHKHPYTHDTLWIQIVLSEATLSVQPRFLYMGAGHVNCKLGCVHTYIRIPVIESVLSPFPSRVTCCFILHTRAQTTQVYHPRLRAGLGPHHRERVGSPMRYLLGGIMPFVYIYVCR